jgi:hypothetical protein
MNACVTFVPTFVNKLYLENGIAKLFVNAGKMFSSLHRNEVLSNKTNTYRLHDKLEHALNGTMDLDHSAIHEC